MNGIWFESDDAGYREWLAKNPNGFVLNHQQGSKAINNKIHKAGCRTMLSAAISTKPGNLTGKYIKFCTSRLNVVAGALQERTVGAVAIDCSVCAPHS